MKKISIVFGTRPEAIKLAPLILKLKMYSDIFDVKICVTGQHREMLDQILDVFEIKPDTDLNLMKPNQSLAKLSADAIIALDHYFKESKPDVCIIQGDTTSVMAASLSAFYNNIEIAHVEAGLRTGKKYSPYPEEMNRVLTSRLADYHFAPTISCKHNLLQEGINKNKIFVTGNTVIDSLFLALEKNKLKKNSIFGLPENSLNAFVDKCVVLITGHRRENFGLGLENICNALSVLSSKYQEVVFIYPVHMNPEVQTPVKNILFREQKNNLYLIAPQEYLSFVEILNRADLVLTDSGGIQEEGLSLGKTIFVMRDTTERIEGLKSGRVKLVGTKKDYIINEVSNYLDNYKKNIMKENIDNPYGDGYACNRIIDILISVYS